MKIRFRVWEPEHKKMRYPDDTQYPDQRKLIDYFGSVIDVIEGCLIYSSDKRAMLSTWSDDKEGREVFDGDVVAANIFMTRSVIVFKSGGFIIRPTTGGNMVTDFSAVATDSMRVIGNIHENPELLEA